ncbi:hypothetical protein SAMN02949497_1206 [Methylomagnum ishizawai]|uniref:Uncharacterized protein n=1 Tax=Methylomagnum ishizawai TaxID=1760988 RepID=A0A1Y6CUN2_9GAMM|nr:hypothetical protein [Methylomagnum ishizawai]SMF93910.1 hypothetical protein SAMN02949497_1206 [Methylomagnum ishizawai]
MTPDALRQALAQNARHRAHASASLAKIDRAGRDRLAAINQRLDVLRPIALTDPEAADEYQALVFERGRILAM